MDEDSKINKFNNLTKGYVSYLKNQKSIKTKFHGEDIFGDFVNVYKVNTVKDSIQDNVLKQLLLERESEDFETDR